MLEWIITQLVNYAPVEIFIVSMEAVIVTCIYKKVLGKWWWVTEHKKPWSITIDSTGWQFSGTGHNPFKTIKKMVDDVRGKDKTLNEEIRAVVKNNIKFNVKQGVAAALQQSFTSPDSKDAIKTLVDNIIKEELGNLNGKPGRPNKD